MKHNSENKTNKENDKDKDKINQAKIDRLKQILSQEKFLRNAADIDNLIVEYRNMNFIKYLMINYGYNYACKFFQTITLKEYNPNTVIYLIGINILYNKIKYQYKGDPNYFEYFVLYGQVANISTVKLDYFSKLLKDGTYFIASNLEGSLVGTNDINANERFRSSISTDCNKINENEYIPKSHTAKCLTYCLLGEISTLDYINIFKKNIKTDDEVLLNDFNFLKSMPLFNKVHPYYIEKFQNFYDKKEYQKDEIVITNRNQIHKLYIIYSGKFELLHTTSQDYPNLIGLGYLSEYLQKTCERFTESQRFELKEKNKSTDLFKVENIINNT